MYGALRAFFLRVCVLTFSCLECSFVYVYPFEMAPLLALTIHLASAAPAPPPAPKGPPAGPPPPPSAPAHGAHAAPAVNPAAVLAELNKGLDVTKGLKK